jgi:hypothetical protein
MRKIAIVMAMLMLASPAAAQYQPHVPGVTRGGDPMFWRVPDTKLMSALIGGEYMLLVCAHIPMPHTLAYVLYLRDEAIARFGSHAGYIVSSQLRLMLAQNPNPNLSNCSDAP